MTVQLAVTVHNIYMYGYGQLADTAYHEVDNIRNCMYDMGSGQGHIVVNEHGCATIISTWSDRQQCEICATQLQLQFNNITCKVSEHEKHT